MNKGDVRVWRWAVLGYRFGAYTAVSPYYKTKRSAEKWLEKFACNVEVYQIQEVNIPAWMAEK